MLAGVLLTQAAGVGPSAPVDGVGTAKGSSLFALGGQITRDTYGIYLVDPENSTITVYQWVPGDRKLELVASRNVAYDRLLDDYNTKPSPREIKELVEMHRRLNDPKVGDFNTSPAPSMVREQVNKRSSASAAASQP